MCSVPASWFIDNHLSPVSSHGRRTFLGSLLQKHWFHSWGHLCKALCPNRITLGVRISTCQLGGGETWIFSQRQTHSTISRWYDSPTRSTVTEAGESTAFRFQFFPLLFIMGAQRWLIEALPTLTPNQSLEQVNRPSSCSPLCRVYFSTTS